MGHPLISGIRSLTRRSRQPDWTGILQLNSDQSGLRVSPFGNLPGPWYPVTLAPDGISLFRGKPIYDF